MMRGVLQEALMLNGLEEAIAQSVVQTVPGQALVVAAAMAQVATPEQTLLIAPAIAQAATNAPAAQIAAGNPGVGGGG